MKIWMNDLSIMNNVLTRISRTNGIANAHMNALSYENQQLKYLNFRFVIGKKYLAFLL